MQIGTSPTSSENCIAGDYDGVDCYEDEFLTKNGGIKVVAPLEGINWDSAAYTTQLDDTPEQIGWRHCCRAIVVRSDGVIANIDSKQLKPGMIVRLAQGDKVPADVLIIGDDGGKLVPGIDRNPYGRQSILIDTHEYDGTIGFDTGKECLVPGPVDETNVNNWKIEVIGCNSSAVLNTWFGAVTINGEDYVRPESDEKDKECLTSKDNMVSLPCHIQSHVSLIKPRLFSVGARIGGALAQLGQVSVLYGHFRWR